MCEATVSPGERYEGTGICHLLTAMQAEADPKQLVSVGAMVVKELGERTRRMEEELQAYRDALEEAARREGIEVPTFRQQDGEDGGAFDVEAMRKWLGELLAEKPRGGTARGGRGSSRGRGGVAAGPMSAPLIPPTGGRGKRARSGDGKKSRSEELREG